MNPLCLPRTTTNLRQQQVDTERGILVIEVLFELCDLLAQLVGCVSETTDDSEAACVSYCCCKLWTCSNVHASQHYRVLDPKEVGCNGPELL